MSGMWPKTVQLIQEVVPTGAKILDYTEADLDHDSMVEVIGVYHHQELTF